MTSVIIIVEGTTQIALTPETEWERTVLEQVKKHQGTLTILSGEVYECQGGWIRARDVGRGSRIGYATLILRLDTLPKPEPEPAVIGVEPTIGDHP